MNRQVMIEDTSIRTLPVKYSHVTTTRGKIRSWIYSSSRDFKKRDNYLKLLQIYKVELREKERIMNM